MKKVTKIILSLSMLVLCTISCALFCFNLNIVSKNKNQSYLPQQPIAEPAIQTATSIIPQNSVFSEITNDGIVSYLKITIPTGAKTIIIKQSVGDANYTIKTDENKDKLGNQTRCYYENESTALPIQEYYFTRPAAYTVYYKTDLTEKTETCYFTPSLISSTIEKMEITTLGGTNTNHPIIKTSDGYYFTKPGSINFNLNNNSEKISNKLYSITAIIKDKTNPLNEIVNDNLLTTIPNNAYGLCYYTITAKNKCSSLTLPIYINTLSFNLDFLNLDNSQITKNEFNTFDDGYCFNKSINVKLTIDASAKDLLGNALTEAEQNQAINQLDFSIVSQERNSINTKYTDSETTEIVKEKDIACVDFTLDKSDNKTHTLKTKIVGDNKNISLKDIDKIKIITKVPLNENYEYVFNAIIGQYGKTENNDYIKGVLNGYLEDGSIIYYPAQSVRLFFTGNELENSFSYIYNASQNTIDKNSFKDFTTNTGDQNAQVITNNSLIYVKSNSTDFDNFYIFSFTLKTYSSGYSFRNELLGGNKSDTGSDDEIKKGKFYINGNERIYIESISSQIIKDPISSFKFSIPSTYEENFIPLYLKVTYNGTVFDNIYKFTNGDEITFLNNGKYKLEFYNIPSYEFLAVNDLLEIDMIENEKARWFYYTIDFTIDGPAIYAYQKTPTGTKTISNNMCTQGTVIINANITEGQKIVIFKNNVAYFETSTSLTTEASFVDVPAMWKAVIYDNNSNPIKELNFLILDSSYQGFSINNKDEYESLKLYKKISTMPIELEKIPSASSYHILEPGGYRIELETKDSLEFTLNKRDNPYIVNQVAYALTTSIIDFSVVEPYFRVNLTDGKAGSRISTKVEITSVEGIDIQKLEVFKGNKIQATLTKKDIEDWDKLTNKTSFSENGIYTIRLTDKFGNIYEMQIEKYYKVNVALIFLILLIIAGLIVLFVTIYKVRRKVKVK